MMKYILLTAFFISSLLSLSSCSTEPKDDEAELKREILRTTGNCIIVPIYTELETESMNLLSAIQTLKAAPTQNNLFAVQEAWRSLRIPWEYSEAFLYGPVTNEDIDPNVDSWPLSKGELDSILASTNDLTPNFIRILPVTLKGFHTIEYLIFGENGNKQASSLTSRELQYMESCGVELVRQFTMLNSAWSPSGDNYVKNFLDAGSAGSLYGSLDDALKTIVIGLSDIAKEVGEGKLSEPFNEKDPRLEESGFSSNSTADFSNNIIGLKAVYLGEYKGCTGKGISALVAKKNAALDQSVRTHINNSINRILDLTPTYTQAIFDSPDKVIAAIDATTRLERVITDSVYTLLFND